MEEEATRAINLLIGVKKEFSEALRAILLEFPKIGSRIYWYPIFIVSRGLAFVKSIQTLSPGACLN